MYNFTDVGLLVLMLAGLVLVSILRRAAGLVFRSFQIQHMKTERSPRD